jgi:cyclohexanecarboxylate-CoA ligase
LENALSLAAALRARGVRPGDIVAVQLPNRHEFAMFALALYAIGAVTMPVPHILRSRDLSRMMAMSWAIGLVVPSSFGSFDHVEMALQFAPVLPELRLIFEVGPQSGRDGVENLTLLLSEGRAAASAREVIGSGRYITSVNQPIMLNFTSGTTGEPKGVLHSRESVSAGVVATGKRLELSASDTIFVAATLGHAGGFLNGIFMPFLLGARVAYLNVWNAGVALRVMAEQGVTYGGMMPPYLVDITQHPDFDSTDLSAWRTARVSGGVIPRAVMDTLHQRLPQLRLCPGWGMSESLYITCAGRNDPVDRRNSTDGRVLDGAELEIRDPNDSEQTLGLGEVGEIVIKAPWLMLGYFGHPEFMATMRTRDGWFKTGDLGVVDSEGFLTVRGRLKELVLRGGENVPIVEVETLLLGHEKVKAVSLVGVPDDRLGERVAAVLVSDPSLPPLDLQEMRAYLESEGLTRQFIPEYLVLRPELPATPNGKIKRPDVKLIALEALGLAESDDAAPK